MNSLLKTIFRQGKIPLGVISGVTLLMIIVSNSGILQSLEGSIRDLFFQLRRPVSKEKNLLVVTIDETDLTRVGDWPIPDRELAQLIRILRQGKPRVIGLDLFRDIPEEPGYQELLEVFRSTPNLIGVESILGTRVKPPPILKDRNQTALSHVVLDSDQHIRRALLSAEDSQTGEIKLTLAALTTLKYLEVDDIKLELIDPKAQIMRLGKATIQPLVSGDAGYQERLGGYQILMNWYGGISDFETISISDVLAGRLEKSMIRNRIVLIGSIAETTNDFFPTPYNESVRGMPGVLVHANLVSQLLNSALHARPLLQATSRWMRRAWILLLATIGACVSWYLEASDKDNQVFIGFRVFLALISLCCLFTLAAYLAFLTGILVPVISPAIALVLSTVLTSNYYKQWQLGILNHEITEANQELEKYSQTLEKTVEIRTAVLTKTNEQLRAAKIEADNANAAKSEFLSSMSHELRTPLNSILGMTIGLKTKKFGDLNPPQIDSLHTIENSSQHLLALINDILDLAKIESGKVDLERTHTSISSLCESSIDIIKHQLYAKHLHLETKLPAFDCTVYIDQRRMRQVLINLLFNAIKFTPSGGRITLEVNYFNSSTENIQNDDTHGSGLRILISDTGIGIAQENLEKLFHPFIQIDSTLNRQYKGTGLGLSLVKQIVNLHGGDVVVNSKIDEGSTFTIELPDVQMIFLDSEQSFSLPSSFGFVKAETKPTRLLMFAEENDANALCIVSYLTAKGFQIEVIQDSDDLFQTLNMISPYIIVLDMTFSLKDILKKVTKIRNSVEFSTLPIIALTYPDNIDERERLLNAGVNDCLSKPIKMKQLFMTIKKYLAD